MIYVDMDGVLADFCTAALKVHESPFDYRTYPVPGQYSMEKILNISASEFWSKIDEGGEAFWANLPEFPWTEELIDLLNRNYRDNWMILSSPSINPKCMSGKMKWLQRLLGKQFRQFMFTPAKYKRLLAETPGAILIDDSDLNCDQFIKDGGDAIKFPQVWNTAGMYIEPKEDPMYRYDEIPYMLEQLTKYEY